MQTQTETATKTTKANKRLGTKRVYEAAQRALADAETAQGAVDDFVAELWWDESLLKAFVGEHIAGLAAQFLKKEFGDRMAALKTGGTARQVSFQATGARRGLGAIEAANQSILDHHITELGIALGDCTKADLDALADRNQRRSQFYRGLAVPLPPGGKVRDHFGAEEVQASYAATVGGRG